MSKRRSYADLVAHKITTYMGRATKDMSNNQLKRLGKFHGI